MSQPENIAIFDGDADRYDLFRIAPPAIIIEILTQLSGRRPERVVDLGCGTGLSTTIWSDAADETIGIEPNVDMRTQASAVISKLGNASVSVREGTNTATGLDDESVDIVTCSQSLHWMEPAATHSEVLRILRPGGVLGAFAYAMPPTVSPELEKAFTRVLHTSNKLIKERHLYEDVRAWPLPEQLAYMKGNDLYGYAKEIWLHQAIHGTATDFVGLAKTYGSIDRGLKAGISESDLGITTMQEIAARTIGDEQRSWTFSYRMIVGVK